MANEYSNRSSMWKLSGLIHNILYILMKIINLDQHYAFLISSLLTPIRVVKLCVFAEMILYRIFKSFWGAFKRLQISQPADDSSWAHQYIQCFCQGWLEGKRKLYWSGLTCPWQPISRWIEVNGPSWCVKAKHRLAFSATRPWHLF